MNIVAIGDVHGCITKLQERIQPLIGSQSEVVFLGDLIDRAPEPNGDLRVLQLVHFMEQNPAAFGLSKVTVLTGNHEQLFLEAFDTLDTELWEYNGGDFELITQAQPFIQWLRERPTHYVVEDFLFVHAGVRPNVPLEKQTFTDLTWIRDPFLDSDSHGLPYTVVHGHTYVPEPEFHSDRIAIDTGACFGGELTALSITL
jgi:serine/threonine protein phosphatase 1